METGSGSRLLNVFIACKIWDDKNEDVCWVDGEAISMHRAIWLRSIQFVEDKVEDIYCVRIWIGRAVGGSAMSVLNRLVYGLCLAYVLQS